MGTEPSVGTRVDPDDHDAAYEARARAQEDRDEQDRYSRSVGAGAAFGVHHDWRVR